MTPTRRTTGFHDRSPTPTELPAVQEVRAAASRARCADHLKQLAPAVPDLDIFGYFLFQRNLGRSRVHRQPTGAAAASHGVAGNLDGWAPCGSTDPTV